MKVCEVATKAQPPCVLIRSRVLLSVDVIFHAIRAATRVPRYPLNRHRPVTRIAWTTLWFSALRRSRSDWSRRVASRRRTAFKWEAIRPQRWWWRRVVCWAVDKSSRCTARTVIRWWWCAAATVVVGEGSARSPVIRVWAAARCRRARWRTMSKGVGEEEEK